MSERRPVEELANLIGVEYKEDGHLKQAVVHRSYLNEHHDFPLHHNERLEFLGDAVLDFIISALVFELRPGADEGDLSKLRASLVKDESLAALALEIGLGNMTQLATDFLVSDIKVNGNAPATIDSIEISADGIVNAQFSDGSVQSLYRIGMASVASPDQLQALSGNLFQTTENSGEVKIGFANSGGNGKIVSGAVESANVDIAEELTDMIQAQRSYTANSKVFQTGSDLMDVLLNVVR